MDVNYSKVAIQIIVVDICVCMFFCATSVLLVQSMSLAKGTRAGQHVADTIRDISLINVITL